MCPDSEEHRNLTKDQIISKTRESLAWMFNDIRICRACEEKANVGAMILTILALDCFAARRRGLTRDSITRDAGRKAFNRFADKYLRGINEQYKEFTKQEPYEYLRNYLIHGYCKDGYIFITNPKKHLHVENGYVLIDVQSFSKDSRTAIDKYLDNLEKDKEDFGKFKKAYIKHPLLGPDEKGKPLLKYEK